MFGRAQAQAACPHLPALLLALYNCCPSCIISPHPALPCPPARFPDLEGCCGEVALKAEMWTTSAAWARDSAGWLQQQLQDVVPAALEEQVLGYHKVAARLDRGLAQLKVGAHAGVLGRVCVGGTWCACCCVTH